MEDAMQDNLTELDAKNLQTILNLLSLMPYEESEQLIQFILKNINKEKAEA